jgi:TRAP-type mannitol/chloroaromatic compound transport system permease small subunit
MGLTPQEDHGYGQAHARLDRLAGRVASALLALAAITVPILILAVVVGVTLSVFRVNALVRFSEPLFLVGTALGQNSFVDMQWHLCALMVTLATPALILTDGHVRVDFLRERFTRRTQDRHDVIGHFVLAMPFVVLSFLPAYAFAAMAFASAEGSLDGGLVDRFLVKGLLALGTGLCGLALLVDMLRRILRMASSSRKEARS